MYLISGAIFAYVSFCLTFDVLGGLSLVIFEVIGRRKAIQSLLALDLLQVSGVLFWFKLYHAFAL